MTYAARVILDSVSSAGARITTMEWTYPRFIHSEVMTYRTLSRNAASARAIPVRTMLHRVWSDPAGPVEWGRNQRGMQARAQLGGWRRWLACRLWYAARYPVLLAVQVLVWLGLHKQVANRLLEPWCWITTIITATEWDHIWRQRCHPDAQPEFRRVAEMAHAAYRASEPKLRTLHLPLLQPDEDWSDWNGSVPFEVSTARCARISYLTHDGRRDIAEDLALYRRLRDADPPHTSPFEHPCVAAADPNRWSGNVCGWEQFRELCDPHFIRREAA
jgi:hypothetical protein